MLEECEGETEMVDLHRLGRCKLDVVEATSTASLASSAPNGSGSSIR